MRSQMCRTASNQSALESIDPGVSIGGSNFEIRPLGADLVAFEVHRLWIFSTLMLGVGMLYDEQNP